MLLKVNNLTKRFGGIVAVDNVSMELKEGDILGIIGPNGAGKTTFINCLSGFNMPEEGSIEFNGEKTLGLSAEKLCAKGISRTFQIVRSFEKMSVLENVKVGAVFGGKEKNPEQKAKELLDFVSFPLDYNTMANQLNNIQLKKLELARALATNCKLLLLDEVAAGLTPSELPDFIKLIKKIRDKGITIICIEHVMKFIMGVSDHIMVFNFGKKIAEGTPDEVKNNEKVTEAYLGEEHVH